MEKKRRPGSRGEPTRRRVPITDGDLDDGERLSPLEAAEAASSVWERMVERLDRTLNDPTAPQGEAEGGSDPELTATLAEIVHLREHGRDRSKH